MKMYYSIFSLLLAVTVVSATLPTPCTPGEAKKDDCNDCFCGTDGLSWACTLMYCAGNEDERITVDNKICEPHHFKTEGSDVCTCLPDGSDYICNKIVKRSIDECEPGTDFMEYCNSCRCGIDGLRKNSACTRRGCQPGMWNQDGTMVKPEKQTADSNIRRKRQEADNIESCSPGTVQKIDCNTCHCGKNGRWICTLMFCL